MKNNIYKILSLIILITYPTIIFSQNCVNLKKLKTFKGILIGNILPQSIIKNTEVGRLGIGDKYYSLSKKELNVNQHKIFDSYFWFLDVEFDNVFFSVTDENELISVQLHTFFNYNDSVESANNEVPSNFTKLYERSVELFGKENNSTEKKHKEDYLKIIFGEEHNFIWKCENIRYEVAITDGSNGKVKEPFNNYTITIFNTDLEKKQRLNKITK